MRLTLIFSLLLLVACRSEPPPPPTAVTPTPAPELLRIGLSDNAAAVADLVAPAYAAETERAALQLIPANNAALWAELNAGRLEAILTHHVPEICPCWFNPVAWDSLALVVHPGNPLTNLSRGEAQAIFSGRQTTWPDGRPIALYSREREANSRLLLNDRVMAEQRLAITAVILPDDEAMITAVGSDPQAIGYLMLGGLNDSVKAVNIDNQPPTPEAAVAQNYPLAVPLYFVTRQEPTGELRAFLAWLQSPAGQARLGEKYGRIR
jgi:ABC-type phosphate transport system substrate-binding protein